jgi:hypothetical protein
LADRRIPETPGMAAKRKKSPADLVDRPGLELKVAPV